MNFPIIPVTKRGMTLRKPIFGKGINDAPYTTCPMVNGSLMVCPFYRTWKSMLARAYSPSYRAKHPTYRLVSVCDDWLIFGVFREWMTRQDWKGNHLDKDILVTGNKIYAPEFCVFVSPKTNSMVVGVGSDSGCYFVESNNKFRALCADISGRQQHLGYFDTEADAHEAWKMAKSSALLCLAELQNDDAVRCAIIRKSVTLAGLDVLQ